MFDELRCYVAWEIQASTVLVCSRQTILADHGGDCTACEELSGTIQKWLTNCVKISDIPIVPSTRSSKRDPIRLFDPTVSLTALPLPFSSPVPRSAVADSFISTPSPQPFPTKKSTGYATSSPPPPWIPYVRLCGCDWGVIRLRSRLECVTDTKEVGYQRS